jgi:hypothetical protein
MQLRSQPPRFSVHCNDRPIQQTLFTVPSVAPIAKPKRRSRKMYSSIFHQPSIFDPLPDPFIPPQFVYSDFDYCVLALVIAIKGRNLEMLERELEYLVTFQAIEMQHCYRFLTRALVPADKRWLVEQRPALTNIV